MSAMKDERGRKRNMAHDRKRASMMVLVERPPAMDRNWFTIKQAAEWLGTTIVKVRFWSNEHSIGKRRRGQHRIFNRLHMHKLWAIGRMLHDLDLGHHAIRRVMHRQWWGWAGKGDLAWDDDDDLILTTADENTKDVHLALAEHARSGRQPPAEVHE